MIYLLLVVFVAIIFLTAWMIPMIGPPNFVPPSELNHKCPECGHEEITECGHHD